MNHCELQALRKLLMIDVSEAAEHIGKVSARTWQYWESSRYNIPEDVIADMSQLKLKRKNMVEQLNAKHQMKSSRGGRLAIPYYQHFAAFQAKFPKGNVIDWRLHQSVSAALFESDKASLEPVNIAQ